ncbi:MAG: BppU family phage baseplate upper protein [Eubacterium aggregans]
MNTIQTPIILEIGGGQTGEKVLTVSQYDANIWNLVITLTQNGTVLDPGGTTARAWGKKPDGTTVSCAGTVSGGVTTIPIKWQAFTAPGNVNFNIEYTDSNQKLVSPRFLVFVEESIQNDDVLSTDEYGGIDQALAEAKAAAQSA